MAKEHTTSERRTRILVIEDKERHVRDAQQFFTGHPEVDVVYAHTYREAEEQLYVRQPPEYKKGVNPSIDGVITDIHYPYSDHPFHAGIEHPIGIRVAVELTHMGLPFVLNTDLGHHGQQLEWINGLRQYMKWPLIETGGGVGDQNRENQTKNWEQAYTTLEQLMKTKTGNKTE